MATILVLSLVIPLAILALLYFRDELKRYEDSSSPRIRFSFIAGVVLLSTGVCLFCSTVILHFDFHKEINPYPWFRISFILASVGLFMFIVSLRKMKKRPKRQ